MVVTALLLVLFGGSYIFFRHPPEPDDLLLFGFGFIPLYYKFRNSIGLLLLAYIVTDEWVVLDIPASIGTLAFYAFLYARIAISIGSLSFSPVQRITVKQFLRQARQRKQGNGEVSTLVQIHNKER